MHKTAKLMLGINSVLYGSRVIKRRHDLNAILGSLSYGITYVTICFCRRKVVMIYDYLYCLKVQIVLASKTLFLTIFIYVCQ